MKPSDLIITGEKAEQALNQLQSATSLNLRRDDNGKITATGTANTPADQKLLEAINDTKVTVAINATSSNYTGPDIISSAGRWFAGGAFGGNKVTDNGNAVVAAQTINPDHFDVMATVSGQAAGVSVMHEALEAFIGAQDNPGTNASNI